MDKEFKDEMRNNESKTWSQSLTWDGATDRTRRRICFLAHQVRFRRDQRWSTRKVSRYQGDCQGREGSRAFWSPIEKIIKIGVIIIVIVIVIVVVVSVLFVTLRLIFRFNFHFNVCRLIRDSLSFNFRLFTVAAIFIFFLLDFDLDEFRLFLDVESFDFGPAFRNGECKLAWNKKGLDASLLSCPNKIPYLANSIVPQKLHIIDMGRYPQHTPYFNFDGYIFSVLTDTSLQRRKNFINQ